MEQPCFKETSLKFGVFLVFTLILSFDSCTAQREVKLQEGPLVRAEGHHITIQCTVSGEKESSEQNFEWSIFRPAEPTLKIQIISTVTSDFFYAIYGERVRNNEIYIERVTASSVMLHITKLQKSDEGEYECYTPNTASIYWGSYNGKMNLTVIPDTLSAISVPQTLDRVEGDTLELTCEVSKRTEQHTHVAVTWYLQKGNQNLQVISLTQDFILHPGQSYSQRQASGDVRLDKIGATSFKLTISKLQMSDQGEFYCEGTEWIQDLDKSWYGLTNKRTEKTTVNVKSIGNQFHALIKATAVNIAVGGSLEIVCTVEAQNFAERFFSIAWFLNKNETVRIGPNAVPSFHGEYKMRAQLGKVMVSKKSDRDYVLKIYQIQMQDDGTYHCQVEETEKGSTGALSTNKSKEVAVTIQQPQTNLKVVINSNTTEVLEGDFLQFACDVHSETAGYGRLSITWQFINQQNQNSDIIGMDQDGMQVTYQPYHERVINSDVRIARVKSDSFTLGIYNALTSDQGMYACKVMEWETGSNGRWQLAGEYVSNNKAVTIESLESSFGIIAMTRTPTVQYYGTFELQCVITPSRLTHVPASVSWKFQPANSNGSYQLVTFTHDTAIKWGDKTENFKGKMIVVKTVTNTVRLSVSRASKLEAGKFLCFAELWGRNHLNQWVRKASATSNILQVKVRPPASLLKLTKKVTTIQKRIRDVTELECKILARTQNDSQFSVTWLFSKTQGPNVKGENLLNIDRNNVIQYYGELFTDSQKKMKFQAKKPSNDMYKLIIQKTDVNDSGSYYCHVKEWLLDPNNIWYKVGENTSAITVLQVHTADVNLQLGNNNLTISSSEDAVVELECHIINQTQTQSQFSVTWSFQNKESPNAKERALLKTDQNNVLQYYGDLLTDPQRKMKFQSVKASSNTYKLIIQRAAVSDSGVYFCNVEEWVSSPQNEWVIQGHARSGSTILQVQSPVATLHSKACASPSLFYFIFAYPFIVFIALITIVLYLYLRPKKPQKPNNEKSLWTPIETFIDDTKGE
ncbi:immunoglobulin superfamily member 3-like [Carcharodon carcharias]|uniref:immunoglobulin superfamily member 3-like n=1 Tax=Carcharodon carcharias TaxID=13397 RepID=UPI001B7E4CFD|nr:immunoglobulin superfamily member 3-like [Carcharodon carcharias]